MTSVLISKTQRKGRQPRSIDPHGFESFGSILRRLRMDAEAEMTDTFSPPLSLKLDFLVAAE